jgi:hypothetical protein
MGIRPAIGSRTFYCTHSPTSGRSDQSFREALEKKCIDMILRCLTLLSMSCCSRGARGGDEGLVPCTAAGLQGTVKRLNQILLDKIMRPWILEKVKILQSRDLIF